jgi:hypothetical protein
MSPKKFVLPSSSWRLIVKSQTWSKWSFRGGLRVESNLTLCGLLNGDVGAFVALNFENKALSLALIYFCSSCSYIAYLGFHNSLSEITCLYLIPEFILLTTCRSRSYLLITSWNRARIEFLSVKLLFRCTGPDLSDEFLDLSAKPD